MVRRIKNPYCTRKPWRESAISYLKSEYPHVETIKIAGYFGRNYDVVAKKVGRLGLRKTSQMKSKNKDVIE